jgi:integrase
MNFSYSIHVRCPCQGPDGKLLGQACPKLWRRDGTWNSKHGSAGFATRIPTASGVRLFKRFGFDSKGDAKAAADHVGELLNLAGADDATRARIGDLIISASKRGGQLPAVADVRRRIGAGADPAAPGVTFAQAWQGWLAGKKRLRPSARERLEQIGQHWLIPVLAEVPVERLNGGQCASVFERIDRINAEIAARTDSTRALVKVDDDVRSRPRPVGVASQHRVYAALREFCNFEVRKTRRMPFNPVYAVELEPEERPEAQRWSAEQAARFLTASADDPLGLLFRIILLRGARRAEACGFRWSGADLGAGFLTVARPLLLVGTRVIEGKPKSQAGERKIWLDDHTIVLLRDHRKRQLAAKLTAGTAWQDNDLVFCQNDGTHWKPDYVSRRFKAIAESVGLPAIKLHEGRHSAASLARDAEVDPEIRRKTLGHADQAMTSHYTHIEAQAHRTAAEAVARLVEGDGS